MNLCSKAGKSIYYDIASEFLVPWIRRKTQERQQQAKLKEAELLAEQERRRAEDMLGRPKDPESSLF
jgi:hypothetical protein